MLVLSILLGAMVLAIIYAIKLYNSMVAFRTGMSNAFAQIDVQLKRRHDLIPNLVATARGYLAHEKSILEALVNARNAAQTASQAAIQHLNDPTALTAMAHAEGALSSSLGRFFAVAEAYPDLKANQTLMQLSEQLTTTENKVAFARQAFNDAVMANNIAVQSFPAVLFAGALGFSQAVPLQALDSDAERNVPVVNL